MRVLYIYIYFFLYSQVAKADVIYHQRRQNDIRMMTACFNMLLNLIVFFIETQLK